MDITKAIRTHLNRHVKPYPDMLVDQLTLIAQDYACEQASSLLSEVLANAGDEWDHDEADEAIAVKYVRHLEETARAVASDADGQWMTIAFMGHVELTGYVTEITLAGHAAFHIDLPEKIWGGNPMAWEEYAASALYSRRPISEESARKQYESRIQWQQQRAEWATTAIESGVVHRGDVEPF